MACVRVYDDPALGQYNFGAQHPFGPHRLTAFRERCIASGLRDRVQHGTAAPAPREAIERFHTPAYVAQVMAASHTGEGFLDQGDTPAFPGVYQAAALVVGTVLAALEEIVRGDCPRAFVPIAGLHHARRDRAAGFCVFNDCGVAIETLRRVHGVQRLAYVDIDAHHGDGVFYAFEADPDLILVDFHEDGRFLYPGTGFPEEQGRGPARGTKRNFPLAPGATDGECLGRWQEAEAFLAAAEPELFILQCGADSLLGDPITSLGCSAAFHRRVAERLCLLAERTAGGRVLALGGGGYDLDNLAEAWCAVVEALETPERTGR